MTMVSASPRITAPYQTEASRPRVTSPMTVALSATKQESWISGVFPSKALIMVHLIS